MEVQVSLPSYGRNYTLPKAYITQYLPSSLLADALQLDPEADTITLDNPIITPGVMVVISTLARGVEPTRAEPDLVAADRYLNAPELLYYSDPLYDRIPNRANINAPANRPIIDEIIDLDRAWLFAYLLARGLVPNFQMLKRAASLGGPNITNLILRDGRVDPTQVPPGQETPLNGAAMMGSVETLRLLLADPRIDPEDPRIHPAVNLNTALLKAARFNQADTLRLLLQDQRVDPAVNDSKALRAAAINGSADVVRILLADGRSDPETRNGIVLDNAFLSKDIDTIRAVLSHPRVQIRFPEVRLRQWASRRDGLPVMRLLLADGRFDPAVNHNAALRIAQRNGNQEMVDLLLADPRVRAALNAN